jgi:hypothetical protein
MTARTVGRPPTAASAGGHRLFACRCPPRIGPPQPPQGRCASLRDGLRPALTRPGTPTRGRRSHRQATPKEEPWTATITRSWTGCAAASPSSRSWVQQLGQQLDSLSEHVEYRFERHYQRIEAVDDDARRRDNDLAYDIGRVRNDAESWARDASAGRG